MAESLNSFMHCAINPFTPLDLGDFTVGWVAPHIHCAGGDNGDWLVTDGKEVFALSFSGFVTRCQRLGLEVPRGVRDVMGYEADLLMNVPVGSIDLSDGVRVDYTERTVQHLLAALVNVVTALKSDTQSKFNNQDSRQAAKTYAKLLGWDYPYTTELRWRGAPISSLETLTYELLKEYPVIGRYGTSG